MSLPYSLYLLISILLSPLLTPVCVPKITGQCEDVNIRCMYQFDILHRGVIIKLGIFIYHEVAIAEANPRARFQNKNWKTEKNTSCYTAMRCNVVVSI